MWDLRSCVPEAKSQNRTNKQKQEQKGRLSQRRARQGWNQGCHWTPSFPPLWAGGVVLTIGTAVQHYDVWWPSAGWSPGLLFCPVLLVLVPGSCLVPVSRGGLQETSKERDPTQR